MFRFFFVDLLTSELGENETKTIHFDQRLSACWSSWLAPPRGWKRCGSTFGMSFAAQSSLGAGDLLQIWHLGRTLWVSWFGLSGCWWFFRRNSCHHDSVDVVTSIPGKDYGRGFLEKEAFGVFAWGAVEVRCCFVFCFHFLGGVLGEFLYKLTNNIYYYIYV